ncbi:hypothetical protein ACFVYR_03070 [Streptomyces sp. NPDC058284]|uniref:hypothetical protein n=1 Tax=unclassified Streptomyces TaxID=2593676 RepID=UPI003657C511
MKHRYARRSRTPRRPALCLPAAVACLTLLSACGDAGGPDEPTAPESSGRQPQHRLLEQFRSWARDNDESRTARHARALSTVELADAEGTYDYDVELRTDCAPRAEQRAKELAALFRTWWDGDDDGTARDVVLLDTTGHRLTHRRL